MRVLILNQEFPAADAELVFVHASDVAKELCCRGHEVTVWTTTRNAPASVHRHSSFPKLVVRRLPFTWFGKSSSVLRILAALSYFIQTSGRLLVGRRPDVLLVSTAPPMIGPVSAVMAAVRRVPVVFWAMDLNPDQLAALGRMDPSGFAYRLLDGCMRWFVRRCSRVIALDDAMASRLVGKGATAARVTVIPPWADDAHIAQAPLAGAAATESGLARRRTRTLLYCGNISPSNPIASLLAGVESLDTTHEVRLNFRGSGGLFHEAVEAARRSPGRVSVDGPVPANQLAETLATADVHVATMGPELTGILHPSKVYAALASGRPVLFVGPEDSPSARLVRDAGVGWAVPHNADRVRDILFQISKLSANELATLGRRARETSRHSFSQAALAKQVADCVESCAAARNGDE